MFVVLTFDIFTHHYSCIAYTWVAVRKTISVCQTIQKRTGTLKRTGKYTDFTKAFRCGGKKTLARLKIEIGLYLMCQLT